MGRVSRRADVSYSLCFTREAKEIGDVCTQARVGWVGEVVNGLAVAVICACHVLTFGACFSKAPKTVGPRKAVCKNVSHSFCEAGFMTCLR